MKHLRAGLLIVSTLLAGCLPGFLTDAATRIAHDLESGAGRLGNAEGARHTVEHKTPSRGGECTGPYQVQLDKVGALVIWCKDAAGATVSSHSTSYHARYVDTPQTWLLEKGAGSTLKIVMERRGARAVITAVQ